jgi:hypothetical protein
MNAWVVLTADLLVGILLVATILSSVKLSRRIVRLKADEASMRATIAELVSASDSAERAVAGLRSTLVECDRDLADRIEIAHRQAHELSQATAASEKVMSGLDRLFETTRRAIETRSLAGSPEPAREPGLNSLQATLAAAQAVAERSSRRLESRAA